MRKVSGWTTEDGSFFEEEKAANLYEHEQRLRKAIEASFEQVNPDKLMPVILKLLPQLKGYVNAYYTVQTNEVDLPEPEQKARVRRSEEAETPRGTGFVSGTEEDLEAVLKLPPRRPRHVPDVGRSSLAEEVPDVGEIDGPRGW